MAQENEKIILYSTSGKIATITLNRPQVFNAINIEFPSLLKTLIEKANSDSSISVIILEGAGRAFCSGYDLKLFAETPRPFLGSQSMPWDPMIDYQFMNYCAECYMSIWRSLKPVICKIRGPAVGGGSDIALCCDQIFMTDDSKIGYPPARLWGVPTTFMWVFRSGMDKAKKTEEELNRHVRNLAEKMSQVPKNQLAMIKLGINAVYDNLGLRNAQTMATIFDGIARHTPEGCAFKARCEEVGFKQAVIERDTDPEKLFREVAKKIPKL